MRRKFGLFLFFTLVLLFALIISNLAISQSNDSQGADEVNKIISENNLLEETDVVSSNEVEVTEPEILSQDIGEELKDAGVLEEIKVQNSITHLTIAEGFIITSDKSKAELFRGLWLVKKFIESNDLNSINESKIGKKKWGFVEISKGNKKEKFKLEIKEFSNQSLRFELKNMQGNPAGNLFIQSKEYERLTLLFGNLTINSGDYAGMWDVTAISKTKIIKPRIEKPKAWNIFAFGKKKKAEIAEKIQQKLFEDEGLKNITQEKIMQKLEALKERERTFEVNREEIIKKRIEKLKKINAAKPKTKERIIE